MPPDQKRNRPRFLYSAITLVMLLSAIFLLGKKYDWRSHWTTYTVQTDALLAGHFELSREPGNLKWDHAWSEGGIHQVWGLGVPLWRVPWQALAQLAGFDRCPDLIAFGLFFLLVTCIVSETWGRLVSRFVGWRGGLFLILVFLVLLGFPPLISMLMTRFEVYEEAIAYSYLFAVLLATILIRLITQPNPCLWWTLCVTAGLGGLIRPTLLFYGAASLLCGAIAMLPLWKSEAGFQWRRAMRSAGVGVTLFCLGGGLLWTTNLVRFGNGFEFGHRLNLQTYPASLYALRFGHPFQDEPIGSAATELFGALFLQTKLNLDGFDHSVTDIFYGQSPTLRWREFSFNTYNVAYFVLLLIGWAIAARAGVTSSKIGWSRLAGHIGDRNETLVPRLCAILGLWSVTVSVLLSCLFLRVPWMTSRYTVDYGAAFSIAILMMVFFVMCRLQSRRMQTIFLLLIVGGWAADIALKRNQHADYEYPTVEPYDYVGSDAAAITDESLQLPANGLAQLGEAGSGIPFDRVGWNQTNGILGPLFVIFVKDPDFLELEISVNPDVHWSNSPKDFRAKIGLEQLRIDFVEETEAGWNIRFHGPQEKRYQAGLQTVFVATVSKEQITEEATPWLMKSARWRSAGAEFQ